jgi:hypothetical protein
MTRKAHNHKALTIFWEIGSGRVHGGAHRQLGPVAGRVAPQGEGVTADALVALHALALQLKRSVPRPLAPVGCSPGVKEPPLTPQRLSSLLHVSKSKGLGISSDTLMAERGVEV